MLQLNGVEGNIDLMKVAPSKLCTDMCMGLCSEMHVGMCVDICVDPTKLGIGPIIGIYIESTCIDMCRT